MAAKFEYPAKLPKPLVTGYTMNQREGVTASEFSTGRTRARQRKNQPVSVKVTWRLYDDQAEVFDAALEHWLLGRYFLISLKLPRMTRMQQVEALIIKDPRDNCKPMANNINRWEYTGELLVKPLPQKSEVELFDEFYAPLKLEDLITQLDTIMMELP